MAGPAAGRPAMDWPRITPSSGVSRRPEVAVCWPAAAVPVRAKMPAPMVAPTPSAMRSMGPSERLSFRSGASASVTSCSGDFVRSRGWLRFPPPWPSERGGGCADTPGPPGD